MNMPEVLDELRSSIEAKRVYADPVREDGITIVPAATVRGGGGGGTDEEGSSGGGFGIAGNPTGAWVLKEGEVHWKPAIDATKVLLLGELTAMVGLAAWRSVRVAQSRRVVTIRPRIAMRIGRRPHRGRAMRKQLAQHDRLRLPWQEKPKSKFLLRVKMPF
jgi:uncharacterized spore protein YtfJ